MISMSAKRHRAILQRIARRAMVERGLLPDFSPQALAEVDGIHGPAIGDAKKTLRDLRDLLWSSIDNDDSRDLDQLTVAEVMPGNNVRILVAISDVDAIVRIGSAIDSHARRNTASVYTAGATFPMLPVKLSTDLTSLNYWADRLAIVVDMVIADDGSLQSHDIYKATVRNRAKLAYNSVAAWLEGNSQMPEEVRAIKGLEENLLIQDRTAQKMKKYRHRCGALSLETIEARTVFEADVLKDMKPEEKNRAKVIVEDFMIAANESTARYLASQKFPSLRRIVHKPKRWDRITELAAEMGYELPQAPDSQALEQFLVKAKAADPLRFPDLSLCVIKLMGAGEYTVDFPGQSSEGHFGLAVRDYTHSTAPNRRYPDLITHRLLKAALSKNPVPYENTVLVELSKHCTEMEDAVKKVERRVEKSAAAILLQARIGEVFDSIVTSASAKGTWVRLSHPPIEGKLVSGFEGLDVGNRVRVKLIHADVEKGFIDFNRVE